MAQVEKIERFRTTRCDTHGLTAKLLGAVGNGFTLGGI